jgi:hypothetical protein
VYCFALSACFCRNPADFFSGFQKVTDFMPELDDYAAIHAGTKEYLSLLHGFYEAFSNQTMRLADRITNVATAVFFFRIWNSWIEMEQKKSSHATRNEKAPLSRDINFVSNQAWYDLEICAGSLCTLIGIFADTPKLRHEFGDGKILPSFWFYPEQIVSQPMRILSSSCLSLFVCCRARTSWSVSGRDLARGS